MIIDKQIVLRKIFWKRSNYANYWTGKKIKTVRYLQIFTTKRLLVNGFAVEIHEARPETIKYIQGYDLTLLAGIEIRAVNQSSFYTIQEKCFLNFSGMFTCDDQEIDKYQNFCRRKLKRLKLYKKDVIKLVFQEDIDIKKLQTIPTKHKDVEVENDSNLSARLKNIILKKKYFTELLTERGLNLNNYQVKEYLDTIPQDNNYVDSNYLRQMTVYVKSFIYPDLRKPGYYSSLIYGSQGYKNQSLNILELPYQEVYLAAKVDRVFWLLLESYLSDFVKVELNKDEGYLEKYYISARTFLHPAILCVSLNGKWKANIPFGSKDNMSYSTVTEVIKIRLQESGINKLKFSCKMC